MLNVAPAIAVSPLTGRDRCNAEGSGNDSICICDTRMYMCDVYKCNRRPYVCSYSVPNLLDKHRASDLSGRPTVCVIPEY